MTTRFMEDDVTEGLTGAVHETGHTLYEQGRNLEHDGLPVNEVGPCSSNLLSERSGFCSLLVQPVEGRCVSFGHHSK